MSKQALVREPGLPAKRGSRRAVATIAMLVLVVLLPGSSQAKIYAVAVRDFSYAPVRIVVEPGDTVRWRNTGSVEHTVTSFPDAPRPFDSSPRSDPNRDGAHCDLADTVADDCLAPGDSFGVRFDEPGTYFYYCKPHGQTGARPNPAVEDPNGQPCGMCGTIEVVAPGSDPTPTATATEPRPRASGSPEPSASPSVAASPTATGTSIPTPSPAATVPAGGGDPGDRDDDLDARAAGASGDGGGGGGRLGVALLALLALSGAAYATWNRFLARDPRS